MSEGEKTKDPNQGIQNLAEYVRPNIRIREEGEKLFVSVSVGRNTMGVVLRQEEGKWVGGRASMTLVGANREEGKREDKMISLLSNITDVRILTTKSKGLMGWTVPSTNYILCRRHLGHTGGG